MRYLPAILFGLLGGAAVAADMTTFYFVDVGHGNSTFVVAPSGEVLVLDAGPPQATKRILDFMAQNGIARIDYMLVTHFEGDHMGAVGQIAAKVPIANFVDHGENVTYGKQDDWWRERRGPWMHGNGWGRHSDQLFDEYRQAREKGRYIPVKPGDRVPVKGVEVTIVSAGGKIIQDPLVKGARTPAACASIDRRADDDAEDGQSVGLVLRHGKFRFVYLGDLTWNPANSLFCPRNLIGPVDAYLATHHGQSMTDRLGPYYFGLSCCSAAEVNGLHPRVAILSMGAQGHKEATPAAIEMLRSFPGLDLWQTEFITEGGEQGFNGKEEYIANMGSPGATVPYIKLEAHGDGPFKVTNSRNGFSKSYAKP
jgi:L-ascorbate metabolism protein UlaG (beta-lactamase superfamily)